MRLSRTLSSALILAATLVGCTDDVDVAKSDSDNGGSGNANAGSDGDAGSSMAAGGHDSQPEEGGAPASGGAESSGGRGSITSGGTESAGGTGSPIETGGTESTGGSGNPIESGGTEFQLETGGASATGGAEATGGGSPITTGGAESSGGTAGSSGSGGSQDVAGAGGSAGTSTTTEIVDERSSVPADTTPDISDQDYAAFVDSANQFGFELGHAAEGTGAIDVQANAVFSPYSAFAALGLAYGGARGDTAAAMKAVLHDDLSEGLFHVAQNRLQRELQLRNRNDPDRPEGEMRVVVAPANAVWAERTLSVQSEFLDLLSREYDTGMWRPDFIHEPEAARLAINGWVEERTQDRIKDLLSPNDVSPMTRVVLVNALYFFANWNNLFASEITTDGAFTTIEGSEVTAPMMRATYIMPYASTESYVTVQLPYYFGEVFLTLVLPAEGQFEAVRDATSAEWLTEATGGLSSVNVSLSLPKFTIETDQIKLLSALEELGMGAAFEGDADFTGLAADRPLFISDVIQKAFIGTDESGTEAAAATAVMMAGGMPAEPVPVAFDRPFLFFIQDKTGLVLFSGQVVDPTE